MSTFVYLYRQIDLLADFADPEPGIYREPEFLEWACDELSTSIARAYRKNLISSYQRGKLEQQLAKIHPYNPA